MEIRINYQLFSFDTISVAVAVTVANGCFCIQAAGKGIFFIQAGAASTKNIEELPTSLMLLLLMQ